jgi:DNA mismatch repair ATPase MutS
VKGDWLCVRVVDFDVARGSIFAPLDHFMTPGGRRQLCRWLAWPVQNIDAIGVSQLSDRLFLLHDKPNLTKSLVDFYHPEL